MIELKSRFRARERARRAPSGALVSIRIDRTAGTPLHWQIAEQFRRLLASDQVRPATRLPSTRALAAQLGVARSTVVQAYAVLRSEGLLATAAGAPARSRAPLPGSRPAPVPALPGSEDSASAEPFISRRGQQIAEFPFFYFSERTPRPFRTGVPALDLFPIDLWERLTLAALRKGPARGLSYGNSQGEPALREALAQHLFVSRGVTCHADQIVITSGAQQAIALAVQVLTDPGDAAWMEDPGYVAARGALLAGGASVVSVPVDGGGIRVAIAEALAPRARLAYVTPGRQLPLGVPLMDDRRTALLAWARRAGSWILEDDYAAEFRFEQPSPAALQASDGGRHVIYIGSFSKVLAPALRIGFAVVPRAIVSAFVAAKRLADFHAPFPNQAVLASFLREGHFERHVRRLRTAYRDRQVRLVDALKRALGPSVEVESADGALHVLVWLPDGWDDVPIVRLAAAQGVDLRAMSEMAREMPVAKALVLGFGGLRERDLADGVARLAALLERYRADREAGKYSATMAS